jgi:hypothetical protein
MSATPFPANPVTSQQRSAAWLEAKASWAGIAIATMWLAVLFVGLFGGDIVSSNAVNGIGNSSKVPVVVVIAFFALIGTIFVAPWGFRERPAKDEPDTSNPS